MNYSIEQLANGRWGIYVQHQLLATIGCYQTCLTILGLLNTRKRLNLNSLNSAKLSQ
jgi:hypothetical protein